MAIDVETTIAALSPKTLNSTCGRKKTGQFAGTGTFQVCSVLAGDQSGGMGRYNV